MNTMFLGLYVKLENLVICKEGQNLVEYALVVALITLGATASMKGLAHAISISFSGISTTFTTAL
jgi:pilus assembly protein Flp/PilA